MPLKLDVGLSKKIGQPDYGTLGASCQVEVELDHALLASDLEGFQQRVRQPFSACRQAVQDELARNIGGQASDNGGKPDVSRNGHSRTGNGSESSHRASRKQLDSRLTRARSAGRRRANA
jgi:hypothetical protein